MPEEWLALNRALWDERVPIHVASDFYDVDAFLAGASTLRSFELEEVGDVSGLTLLHAQCHFGLDTLSWARRGARVTGLDFSEPAIAAARKLAADAGIEAEFVASDVYEAAAALGGRQFDVVYTGLGALNWLPDVERWARVMASLVAPGGRFYLAEFHPFSAVFAEDALTVKYPYFHTEPFMWDEPGTYADAEAVRSRTAASSGTTGSARSSPRSSPQACASSSCTSTTTRCSPPGRSWSGPPTAPTGCRLACCRCRSCTRCWRLRPERGRLQCRVRVGVVGRVDRDPGRNDLSIRSSTACSSTMSRRRAAFELPIVRGPMSGAVIAGWLGPKGSRAG